LKASGIARIPVEAICGKGKRCRGNQDNGGETRLRAEESSSAKDRHQRTSGAIKGCLKGKFLARHLNFLFCLIKSRLRRHETSSQPAMKPLSFALLILAVQFASAKPVPSALFSDHAVLHTRPPDTGLGTADPGEPISVTFAGKEYKTTTDTKGSWRVDIDPQPASSDPRTLEIRGHDASVTLQDILVGEVWLASGQSNMGMTLSECANATSE
jgi:hypothetical protein